MSVTLFLSRPTAHGVLPYPERRGRVTPHGSPPGSALRCSRHQNPMEILMKTFLLLVLMLTGLTALTGCNTFRGLGEDVEEAGDAVKDATN